MIPNLFFSLAPISRRSERQPRPKPFATYGLRRLRKHIVLTALSTLALFSFFPSVSGDEHASTPVVLALDLHGVVEPILATYR